MSSAVINVVRLSRRGILPDESLRIGGLIRNHFAECVSLQSRRAPFNNLIGRVPKSRKIVERLKPPYFLVNNQKHVAIFHTNERVVGKLQRNPLFVAPNSR